MRDRESIRLFFRLDIGNRLLHMCSSGHIFFFMQVAADASGWWASLRSPHPTNTGMGNTVTVHGLTQHQQGGFNDAGFIDRSDTFFLVIAPPIPARRHCGCVLSGLAVAGMVERLRIAAGIKRVTLVGAGAFDAGAAVDARVAGVRGAGAAMGTAIRLDAAAGHRAMRR
ncbi:MAG: hypothetical protein J0M09_18395 [Xanthomonadales bacterium]|nr:hypothetical protein [Xanthomonadales bacterium]